MAVSGGYCALSHCSDFVDDVIDLLAGQFREHGQRDAGGGVVFGVGQRTGDARRFAPRIAGLLMDGDGIMRLGIDAGVVEKFQETVPLGRVLGFDDVKMKNMAAARRLVRQREMFARP